MFKIQALMRLTAGVTSKSVSKAIKARYGMDVDLINGRGYFYFVDRDSGHFLDKLKTISVYVNSINQLTLDEWLEEFEALLKDSY